MVMLYRLFFIVSISIVGCATRSFAQKLSISPKEYINSMESRAEVIGEIEDKTACFLEEYDGYKVLWYDSIQRKWGQSALDFLEGDAEYITARAGEKSVQIFYQQRKERWRYLYSAKVLPLHRDTILPILIDSVELQSNRDRSHFTVFDTENKQWFAYGRSAFSVQEKQFAFAIQTVDANGMYGASLRASFGSDQDNSILSVHINEFNKIAALLGEPDRSYRSYQKIRVAQANGSSQVSYKNLDLSSRVQSPRVQYDSERGEIHFAGICSGTKYRSGLSACYASFSQRNQSWSQITTMNNTGENATDLNRMLLRHFVPRADGGVVFFLEKSFEEIQTRSRSMAMMPSGMIMGGGSYNYSVYHNDEVRALSMAPNGSIDWQEEVSKSQESSYKNNELHSYGILQHPMGSILFFVDEIGGEPRFVTSFLSKDGEKQQRQFASGAYPEMMDDQILIREARQVNTNSIIFPVRARRIISFVKIKF